MQATGNVVDFRAVIDSMKATAMKVARIVLPVNVKRAKDELRDICEVTGWTEAEAVAEALSVLHGALGGGGPKGNTPGYRMPSANSTPDPDFTTPTSKAAFRRICPLAE